MKCNWCGEHYFKVLDVSHVSGKKQLCMNCVGLIFGRLGVEFDKWNFNQVTNNGGN